MVIIVHEVETIVDKYNIPCSLKVHIPHFIVYLDWTPTVRVVLAYVTSKNVTQQDVGLKEINLCAQTTL